MNYGVTDEEIIVALVESGETSSRLHAEFLWLDVIRPLLAKGEAS